MKKIILLIGISLFIQINVSSQPCPPGGITFSTQASIDNFQINYPGCTEILGEVVINGDDITNLDGLSVLTSIGGYFYINNCPTLTSITGLSGLTFIGGYLNVWACSILPSLSGLENVPTIGGYLVIVLNDSITTLSGLDNLTSIEGYLSIWFNDGLTSLTGLNNVSYIGENIEIIGNDTLESLYGLENVSSIGGHLLIEDNKSLISLVGLNNLTSIDGYLDIYNNDVMPNLSDLVNLTSIGGYLKIHNNSSMTSLTGLDNIDAATILDLGIYYNYLLSSCEVQSVCDYLVSPGGSISIHNNTTGCNNQDEVEDSCIPVSVDKFGILNEIIIQPNPFSSFTTIEYTLLQPSTVHITIYNLIGEQVEVIRQQQSSGKQQIIWNADGLPSGVYYIRMQYNDRVASAKILVAK